MRPALPWHLQPSIAGLFKTGFFFLFSLPFLAGGVFCFWHLTLENTFHWWQARDWEPTPAVIQKAWLEADDEGDSYRVATEFTYTFHGQRHLSRTYSLSHSYTNVGTGSMRRAVARLQQAQETTCWVNPALPAQAVIDRTLPMVAVIGFFFSMPFLTVGLVGLSIPFLPWLQSRTRHLRLAEIHHWIHLGRLPFWATSPFEQRKKELHSSTTALLIAADARLPSALGALVFNLFWNGIVAVFVCVAVSLFTSGDLLIATLLSLFLVPFVAIGAAGLRYGAQYWRHVFRPKWIAVFRPVPDFAGGLVEFGWVWAAPQPMFQPPHTHVRLVALARLWDEESERPGSGATRPCRAHPSDPNATQRAELQLAAVDIPVLDAPHTLHLPPIKGPATWANQRLAAASWGAWWQLEVTHSDGGLECLRVTEPIRLT